MVWLILCVSVFNSVTFCKVGDWKSYTSKREVRAVALNKSNEIWAATSGGLFKYNITDNSFQEFTPSEGLHTLDLTALVIDDHNDLWIGGADGYIHRYTPVTGEWLYITDIFSDLNHGPAKRINKFEISGDTLFILSDLGVSVFSISKLQFGDSYLRFGVPSSLISGSVTGIKKYHDTLWVSTRNGIAFTPAGNSNPSSPQSWSVLTQLNGLGSNNVNDLKVIDGKLIAATSNGVSQWMGNLWITLPGSESKNILSISLEKDTTDTNTLFYFVTSRELFNVSLNYNVTSVKQFTSDLSGIGSSSILGTASRGVICKKNISPSEVDWIEIIPPGPHSNKFVSVIVDGKGIVWSATGSANGDGFMSFNGTTWRSYTTATEPNLCSNDYHKASIGSNDSKWMGNWGCGVTIVDAEGNVQKTFNTTNGLPPTVENNLSYVVVGGVAVDQMGDTWIINRTAPGDTAVVVMKPDSSLDYHVKKNMRNPLTIFNDVVVDQNNTKWFATTGRFDHESSQGLFYYNDKPISPGVSQGWGRLTTDNGLTSYQVWSLAVDHNGELWIGSDQGITIIFNPADPVRTIATYHPLRDQTIQDILVDACDNKWIATKQGVFVLSPDGTSILERYTSESTNRKLLDDDVTSIGLDGRTGTIYFGTEKGLSSLTTPFVAPRESFDELVFKPNPFVIPSINQLTVDGLIYSSTIKILNVNGNLVKNLSCPCGRVGFWDGTDENGTLVSTGVYIIVAYSEDGTKAVAGKLAVIRR